MLSKEDVKNLIDEYDFLQKFLVRIQSKDSWRNYTIESNIKEIVRGKYFSEMMDKLPPTISKAVSDNNSFNVYFYDNIFDKWYGIVSYTKPTCFAIGREEPIHNEQFTLLEFQ